MVNKNTDNQMLSSTTDIKSATYEWTIRNYNLFNCDCFPKKMSSPSFKFDIQPNVEWTMQLDVKLVPEEDFVNVFLERGKTENIFITLSLLTISGELVRIKTKKLNENFTSRKEVLYTRFPKSSSEEINNLFPSNVIVAQLKVVYLDSVYNTTTSSDYEQCNKLLEINDFAKLIDNKKFSDFEIIVGNRVFSAHKNILSARSLYFSAMIENDTKKSKDNKVVINDVRPEVMQEVLSYIYTGKVNNLDTLKMDIFVAADKYMLEELKNASEKALIQDIKTENIFETLQLADKHNSKNLLLSALRFFAMHKKEIVSTNKVLREMFKQLSL